MMGYGGIWRTKGTLEDLCCLLSFPWQRECSHEFSQATRHSRAFFDESGGLHACFLGAPFEFV